MATKGKSKRRPTAAAAGPQPRAAADAVRRGPYLSVLALILVVAAGLRLYAVQTANLWLDEFMTLELASGNGMAHEHLPLGTLIESPPNLTSLRTARPAWAVWTSMGEVTHPPLFYLVLRLWRDVLGASDTAVRLLPLLASLAAVALMYLVARQLHGPGPALWAAALMALAGQQIYHAQEVRGYSLMLALGLGALAALVAIEQRGPSVGRAAALFGCLLAMLLTHYFTAGAVAAVGLYALVRLRGRARAWAVGAVAAAGVVFLVAWGPFMWRQRAVFSLESGQASFLADPSPHPLGETFVRLFSVPGQYFSPGPSNRDILPWRASPAANSAAFVALAVAAGASLLAAVALNRVRPRSTTGADRSDAPDRSRGDNRRRTQSDTIPPHSGTLLWCLWLCGTVGVLLALDVARHSKHLAFSRYTLLGSPAAYALIAAGTWRFNGLLRHALPAAWAAACLALLPAALRAPAEGKVDWQPAATALAESAGKGDPLVLAVDAGNVRSLYLFVTHYLDPVGRPVLLLPGKATPDQMAVIRAAARRGSGRAWVVYGWQNPPAAVFPGGGIRPLARLDNGNIAGELILPPERTPAAAGSQDRPGS